MSAISGSDGSHENHLWSPLLLVLACAYTILFGFVFRRFAYGEPGGFPVFYTAGKLARYDLRGLYSVHLQNVFHPLNDRVGYFFHLPYETILLVPLSYLPQTLAFAVWTLLNLGCLVGVALILRRHFPEFAWLTPFAFGPTLSLLLNGQDLGILALLVALAFDLFAREKDLQAGAILALGLFKFPLIVPLVAILAFRYWRVFLGFIAVSAPLLLGSALVVGKQGIQDYLALTHGTDAKEAAGILINLRGMMGVLFGPHTVLVIVLSVALVALGASIKATRIPVFCVALIVTQLVSWHAHLYDALILLIPMAWMLESKSRWIQYTPTALILMTAPMLLVPSYGYLLAIFLLIVLSLILIPRSSRMMLAGTCASGASGREVRD
jgi:hypothetical protein